MNKGMSLIEILVVVSVFSVLGILTTQAVILTLGGSKKSETQVVVRENLNYSIGVIERQIRNAGSIVTCPNPDTSTISYVDQEGVTTSFSCVNDYIASGSARLTSDTVSITSCSFVCTPGTSASPPSVTIDLSAESASASGVQKSSITATTQVYLRNY